PHIGPTQLANVPCGSVVMRGGIIRQATRVGCRNAAGLQGQTSNMTTASLSAFATLLRSYRLEAGLTQEALAERAGLSARTVSDLERGFKTKPRRETVELLAVA